MARTIPVKRILIVGYGNTLRSDDGLGPYIVQEVARARMPDGAKVRIECLPQLDVSLVPRMSEADAAIFVDARQDGTDELVRVERIEHHGTSLNMSPGTHNIALAALLRIVDDWYGKTPLCYLVLPKGFNFSIGEYISSIGLRAASRAVDQIMEIIRAGVCACTV